MRPNAKHARQADRTRIALLGLLLLPGAAFSSSDWTRPAYGIEVYSPRKQERDYWLGALTASTSVKPSRMPVRFLGASVQGGILVASGSSEGHKAETIPGLMASASLRLMSPAPRKYKTFFEASLGFTYFLEPFPAGGSKVNGLVRWGTGVEIFTDSQSAITVALRRAHLSNGGGLNAANPSWDGTGLSLTWRRRG